MKITIANNIPADGEIIRFLNEDGQFPADLLPEEFSGKANSLCLLRENGRRVLYAGLGKSAALGPDRYRKAAGTAARHLAGIGAAKLVISVEESSETAGEIVDGIISGVANFEDFLPAKRKRKTKIGELVLVVPEAETARVEALAEHGRILAEASNLVRHLGNCPPNIIFPESLAAKAEEIATACGLEFHVRNEADLQKENFGGLLAVGGGSVNPPCLIEMRYNCGTSGAQTVAVVGKAVTFDSGGISLKPGAGMDEMKFDKMGGCAVLGIMQAVARLKLPVNVVGLIPAAENMPGSRAYRPSDIVTAWDGQTIEVLNTDAEGRVVLADALGYARDEIKPDRMLSLATLTGACVVALGMHRSGVFTDNTALRDELVELGEKTGDRLWPLPVGEEYSEDVKSDIATVKNAGSRWGGASTAASFLKTWTGEIPWAHLDIAGTASHESAKPWAEKGATGVAVRVVVELISQMAKSK